MLGTIYLDTSKLGPVVSDSGWFCFLASDRSWMMPGRELRGGIMCAGATGADALARAQELAFNAGMGSDAVLIAGTLPAGPPYDEHVFGRDIAAQMEAFVNAAIQGTNAGAAAVTS